MTNDSAKQTPRTPIGDCAPHDCIAELLVSQIESKDAELAVAREAIARYRRISESGESLGGELEEREARMNAESECDRLSNDAQKFRSLLIEWRETELDSMDEEFEPWMESFTTRVDAALTKEPSNGQG